MSGQTLLGSLLLFFSLLLGPAAFTRTSSHLHTHRSSTPSKINLTLGFLPSLTNDKGYSKYFVGALKYALDRINEQQRYPFHLHYQLHDNKANSAEAIRGMTTQYFNGTVAFIGPEASCATEARIAAAWNLPMIAFVPEDSILEIMRRRWQQSTAETSDFPSSDCKQSSWDTPLLSAAMSGIESRAREPYDLARLNAIQAPHASDWLFALPLAAQGLRLNDEEMRVAVGLRLGAVICAPHACACGTMVSARGSHGLACSLGFGRQARHSTINDIVLRSLIRAGIPSIREPVGLTRLDGKRPDGQTLIPWKSGRSLIWDVTIIDTFAPSYLAETSAAAGGAAEIAATRKQSKYAELQTRYCFTPIAIETMGPMDHEGLAFILELGRRLTRTTEDLQETFFLFQKISVTIQRFNAIACLGSMRP